MLLLLFFILLILLIFEYQHNNKELISPIILYLVPFIVMILIALFNAKQWSFEINFTTFVIVIFGSLAFSLGTSTGNRIKLRRNGKNSDISCIKNGNTWKYVLFLIAQIIIFYLKIRYILAFARNRGVTGGISSALRYLNDLTKFTTEDTVHYPFFVSLGLDICTMFGFSCACLFAQQFFIEKRKKVDFILILLNFIIAFIGGSTSGGRGGSVQVIVSFICSLFIFYQRKNDYKKTVSLKIICLTVLILIGVLSLFIISIQWIGRYPPSMILRYITNYIGVQIYNFNSISETESGVSEIFGQETFYPMIQKICSLLGISKWANYHVGYPNVYSTGYNTGNVYTCYYSYIKDFGLIGAIILPFIFGCYSQIIYRSAKRSDRNNPITTSLVYYSNLSYMIIFSFFADKFGSIVFSPNMIKRTIILYIINVFLFDTDMNTEKTAIIVRYQQRKTSVER
ncbi:MAG: oligosaccharide repeat unit polymerase [Anaerolineaceae bacterium]|nr:oligosaccharide repeat unit polymerase [Anaerolineaceae bacterium]